MISRRALFSWMVPRESDGARAAEEAPEAAAPAGHTRSGEPGPVARGRVAWQLPREAPARPLGSRLVAAVSPFQCLNAGADFCATCVERCPRPGALRTEGRRVRVDPTRCDGCGQCVPLCPAPGGAILLHPVYT